MELKVPLSACREQLAGPRCAGARALLRWRGWLGARIPLLWSLHLSYACLPLGLASLALDGDPQNMRHHLHLLAVGVVGGMILAMMARVSLGHTGRALEAAPIMAWAFALVLLAALLRAWLPLLGVEFLFWSWRLPALLWLVAFGMFLKTYVPILLGPRADGRAI